MKNSILILLAGLALLSCDLGINEDRVLQDGNNTAMTRRCAYVSNTTTELVFETDVSLLNQYGGDLDIDYLSQDAFSFAGPGTYTILEMKTTPLSATGKSSTVVIMDQSGSYSEVDFENRRSKSLDKFFYDVKSPSDFILSASAKGGQVSPEPLEFYRPDFSTDAEVQVSYLFGLAKRTGGKNAILDAMSLAIDKLTPATGLKNVVALVHGMDEASTVTIDALIAKAVAAQVRLSIVLLGKADAASGFAKVAGSTGGLLTICPSENEMITSFNHLYRLLSTGGSVYRLKVKFVPPSGTLISGTETWHTLQTHYALEDYDYNPVLIHVKIP